MSDRSMLAEIYVEPWRLLLQPKMAGDGRVAFAVLSAMSWLVTAGTLFVLGWLAFFLLDDTGRPVVTYEGAVISRSWRPAFASVTTAPVISSNGQVGAMVVPDYEPERYTVCMRVKEQSPALRCARPVSKCYGRARASSYWPTVGG